jgi:hypothetical protein
MLNLANIKHKSYDSFNAIRIIENVATKAKNSNLIEIYAQAKLEKMLILMKQGASKRVLNTLKSN